MLQITHKTTDYAIEHSTVQELREVLNSTVYGSSFNGLKKLQLVDAAKTLRNRLKIEQEVVEAEAEKVKQARIEFEKGLPNAAGACKLISEAFEAKVAEANAINAKFMEQAAKYGPADAIKWMAEDTFEAIEALREFTGWARCFEKQAVEPTRTIEEVHQLLEESADRYTDSAMTCSMYPTNAMQSLEQVGKYKTHAKLAKMFKRAAKYYKAAAESTDSEQLNNLAHLSFCL